jgi:recombination protein RecA
MKIGVMFGNPETTSGGNALKFYSTVRLDIRRIGAIKKGNEVVGNRTRVKVVKNKLAPPFRVCEFDIIFNEGISKIGDLLDLAVEAQLVEKSGSWFSYNDDRIGQGRENVRDYLTEKTDLLAELEARVRGHYSLPAITDLPEGRTPDKEDGGNGKDPKKRPEAAPPSRKKPQARS